MPHFEISVIFFFFGPQKTHFRAGRHKNNDQRLSTLVLEFFCQSKFSCYIFKFIQKIQKSTSPTIGSFHPNFPNVLQEGFLKISGVLKDALMYCRH
jgi:hypothetical protein